LLGDDANQFATGHDNAAFVEDGDDDLLGGGGGEEVTEFESSFPAIDTRNEVCFSLRLSIYPGSKRDERWGRRIRTRNMRQMADFI
jgi:hypothetical protein